MGNRLAGYAFLAFIVCMVACSVSDRTLNNADKRIKTLKTKGVPDSALSPSIVYLYQAREAKRKNMDGDSRAAAKLLRVELGKAEAMYRDNISNLKPAIDSLRVLIQNARKNYTGMELKKFDSCNSVVDSFLRIEWMLQAYTKAQELANAIPTFNFDSERAKELRSRIPGEWVCINKTKGTENKNINALEKKIFTFEKNGKVKFVENKKGQSGPYLKEDWEFVSLGTWDVNGDTVHTFVNRFSAVRQMFERMYLENGGKVKKWKKEPGPTYDSAITDGSQDRFITFSDLKSDFEQTKKF